MSQKRRRASLAAAALSMALSLIACSDAPIRTHHPELFSSAEKFVGQTVRVDGYLRYVLENRNLFPSASMTKEQYCLPIFVSRDQPEARARAEGMDGRQVVVTGVIVPSAPPGYVAVDACKEFGIKVESLELAR